MYQLEEAKKLMDTYYSWLRDNTFITQDGEAVRIDAPVLNRHNDYFQIYLVPTSENDGYLLTDLGQTINDLSLDGFDIYSSNRRKEALSRRLNSLGVHLENGELHVRSSKNDFRLKKHLLVQAMSAVDDMYITNRKHTQSMFKEDVENWLDDNNVHFTSETMLTGVSGMPSQIDFIIPKNKKQTLQKDG